jgi:hypothetical protein
MAASVAWPRLGKEGSGSQCWHFIEGGREGDWTRRDGFGMQIEEKIIQFLFVESILIYIRDL